RKPERVVGPHAKKRDRGDGRPERDGLVGLRRRSDASLRAEDVAVKLVAVDELEPQHAVLLHAFGANAELLLDLPHRRLFRGLARLDATAGAVDLPCAEAALLLDEEDAIAFDDE